MQFLLHISPLSSQIWKIPRQKEVVFFLHECSETHTLMLPFAPYLLSNSEIWNISRKKWIVVLEECLEYPNPYIIYKNAILVLYLLCK